MREICLQPDKVVPSAWRVEVTNADGSCAVTIFAGFEAEERAREYADWLRSRDEGVPGL
jgi:hypothetical protein